MWKTGSPMIVACCLLLGLPAKTNAADDYFSNNVIPILQRRCLSCHNDSEHKGDFSLQTSESAFADGYIGAGDSGSSDLVDMITPVDGKAQMPKNSDPLTSSQIVAIRKWIDDGAQWPDKVRLSAPKIADLDWWSLRPLRRPTVPTNWSSPSGEDANESEQNRQKSEFTLRTPIDAFIKHKLDQKGLTPAREASRLALVRRLYSDLIGLPPSPEEVKSFLQNDNPNAYELLVDRLLESKHYGERWARHWLDVVHYADTHGYDKDKQRPNAWPYRDYVIRSLNGDKPYGRFVMEQIAGDSLWPETVDGVTATGFIAAGPWDFIGHVEVPETKIDGRTARNLDRDDMVSSTMNTFCSTTIQCARCHNHKFDPVTQEHYYSLQAVFAALDRADRPFDQDPQTAERRRELTKKKTELVVNKTSLNNMLEKAAGKQLAEIDAELSLLRSRKENAADAKPEFGYHSQIESAQNSEKWIQIDLGEPTPIESITFVGCHDNFNGIGHGFGFPLRYKIEVSDNPDFQSGVTVIVDHTNNDVANPGTNPQTVNVPDEPTARYVRMTAMKLANRKNDYIFALAEISVQTLAGRNAALGKDVTSLDSIEAPPRWQRKNLVDGYYFGLTASPDSSTRITKLIEQRKTLIEQTVSDSLKEKVAANQAALKATTGAIDALPPQGKIFAGVVHHGKGNFIGTGAKGGQPREIHLLHRGDILKPRDIVGPGTIPVIAATDWRFQLPPSHDESDRRVALARWLVHRDNPLTWRSIVNRIWQYHFGRGIVDSPNDFGRMGQQPSHPELLDWLAVEFRDGGQSLKKLHKLIVTSSVYRQSSVYNEQNSQLDSENKFLWRMNRRRLTAEELRDAVLSIAGKIDRTMYGPGFQLFTIEHPEHSPHYQYHKHDPDDPKSHRRSIYRFVVRSQPDPFMTTLDCADSSQSVPKREETVTALQALSLLNNKFMLRMAEQFSQRMKSDSGDRAEQVELAFQRVTGHLPTQQQRTELTDYADEFGDANLCRLLFNLNEFVFVD